MLLFPCQILVRPGAFFCRVFCVLNKKVKSFLRNLHAFFSFQGPSLCPGWNPVLCTGFASTATLRSNAPRSNRSPGFATSAHLMATEALWKCVVLYGKSAHLGISLFEGICASGWIFFGDFIQFMGVWGFNATTQSIHFGFFVPFNQGGGGISDVKVARC